MISHITLHVSDIDTAKEFYGNILAPLHYKEVSEYPEWKVVGLGIDGKSDLWLVGDGAHQASHVAFSASSKSTVDMFYEAAMAGGAKDNGAPGYRKDYAPGYYAAFITDQDGHNIEAVFMDAEPSDD